MPGRWLAVLSLFALIASEVCGQSSAQRALDEALSGTNAIALVLDGQSGRPMAMVRGEEAGRLASAPGSTLKPFFLAAALRQGRVRADTPVVCHGNLRIAGRDLACTHPRDENILNAERALAYSCNEWFANLATRFSPAQATDVLGEYGFGNRTGLRGDESAGFVGKPASEAELQLFVLGVMDVEVTPAQMARGYFRLSQQLNDVPVVRRGLEGSIAYGMAHNAATSGVTIEGKTGTASDAGETWTHGWFAGIAARGRERVVMVVYVPHGNGADAAQLAHRFFEMWEQTAAR